MPPARPSAQWVTASEAADRLGKASGTVYSWATRYHARKVKVRGATFFHLPDLRVIEREIMHAHPVPATWQERGQIACACPLRDSERFQQAA